MKFLLLFPIILASCTTGTTPIENPDASTSLEVSCGDGVVTGNEECDDGNRSNDDGCLEDCKLEPGYACSSESVCEPECGDGLTVGDELCDDGNFVADDGCHECQVEAGWACDDGACSPICGDGDAVGDEPCDDGNSMPGDGCDADCQVEEGWSCLPGTSVRCWATCGDALLVGAEECDDGNDVSGDGCDDCRQEVCADDVCALEARNGEPCTVAEHCGSKYCNTTAGHCGVGATGTACGSDADCEDSCNAATQKCGLSAEDEPCLDEADCDDNVCHPGLNTCGLSAPGEPCEQDNWCGNGYCEQQVCKFGKFPGSRCAGGRECLSGECGRGRNDPGYDVCVANGGYCGTSCYSDGCYYGCKADCEFDQAPPGCIGCQGAYNCAP